MILLLAAVVVILLIVFGPHLWVKHVMAKHAGERTDFPGTGGEFARHLLDQLKLSDVKVESTDDGDHYDPDDRAVRLSRAYHDGRSLTGVAIAAHEVSHAIQHARGEKMFELRTRLAGNLVWVDRLALVVFALSPLAFLFVHAPQLVILQLALGVAFLSIHLLVHVSTLPLEFDASFGKALPMLEQGGYLAPDDISGARQVLCAAAMTYVAAALVTLLDFARLLRLWR